MKVFLSTVVAGVVLYFCGALDGVAMLSTAWREMFAALARAIE